MPSPAHKFLQLPAEVEYIELPDSLLGILRLDGVFMLIDDNLENAPRDAQVLLIKPGLWYIAEKKEVDAFTRRYTMHLAGSEEPDLPFEIAGWILATVDCSKAA